MANSKSTPRIQEPHLSVAVTRSQLRRWTQMARQDQTFGRDPFRTLSSWVRLTLDRRADEIEQENDK